eukprot:TRINITY_DN114282_c0_g1_i1.p1 TRINITY_DN114282_c0_g1~~TRINITY_DN114282_c0_g1_i1.p1  ORF type:complete len:220 (-),score=44.24 TRINITY_DN114282_c0_g1_i1:39-698(-)
MPAIAICTTGLANSVLEQPLLLKRQLLSTAKPHVEAWRTGSGVVDLFYELSRPGSLEDRDGAALRAKVLAAITRSLRGVVPSCSTSEQLTAHDQHCAIRVAALNVLGTLQELQAIESFLRVALGRNGTLYVPVEKFALLQLWGWQRCHDSIVAVEAELRRLYGAFEYDAVIRQRADAYWFLPMPSTEEGHPRGLAFQAGPPEASSSSRSSHGAGGSGSG